MKNNFPFSIFEDKRFVAVWIKFDFLTAQNVSFGEQNPGNSKKNNFLKATKVGSCERNLEKERKPG
jgi:hypothetical protein